MSKSGTLIVNPGLVSAVRKLYDGAHPRTNCNGPSVIQDMDRQQEMWQDFYRKVFCPATTHSKEGR